MSNIIDLTRSFDGELNGISLGSAKINRDTPILPSYLQEINLGDIRAAYFTEGLPPNQDFFYYNLVWMKIPAGFDYVKYTHNLDGSITLGENIATPDNILTPILLLFNDAGVPINHHICSKFHPINTMGVGGQNGCSGLLTSFKKSAASPHLGTQSDNIPQKPFFLFRYQGNLRMTVTTQHGSSKAVDKDTLYYLLPMMLSDKTVVYYAVGANDLEVLKIVFDNALAFTYAEVDEPLTMNDAMGIFVTGKIKFQNA